VDGPRFLAPKLQVSLRPPLQYVTVREVDVDEEFNWSGRTVKAGELFYRFTANNFSSDPLPGNILLSAHGPSEYPFFEFPLSALAVYSQRWLEQQ
jgi:hypothetical protein